MRAGTRLVAAGALLASLVAGAPAAFAAPAATSAAASVCAAGQSAPPGSSPGVRVIVSASGVGTGPADAAAHAVRCAAGRVEQSYSAIDGVLATVPGSRLAALQSDKSVVVVPDVPVSVQSTVVSTVPHTPSDVFRQETGAASLVSSGDTGQGINVAVIDTGIDALPDFAGRLVAGVDLTGDRRPFTDRYGHGTFVAGLIAGDGASSAGRYSGEAPGAGLISVKVAGPSGQTDLASVIAGVDWVIAHRASDHIRVLNMSLGFQPVTSAMRNPLDLAVNAAWRAGIVVVTSAGNAGPFNGTIMSPGDDPLAITVGALDDMATRTVSDDEMTDFSSVGPTNPDGFAKPDLVASGRSVVSLAAPGSTVYEQNGSARVGDANFVGSGTSFSTAITSGAVALLLSAHPDLTPDQVKARLLANTRPGPVGNPFVDGHGALDVAAAVASGPMDLAQSTHGLRPVAFGTTVSLAPSGPADTWNPSLWTGAAWNGAAWNGAAWNGAAWNGAAWNGAAWNGAAWNGAAWNGAAWNGAAWNGAAWKGAAWNGAAWNGAAWNGAAWNGAAWNGAAWN